LGFLLPDLFYSYKLTFVVNLYQGRTGDLVTNYVTE
jgi:hypothetical protein